MQRDTCHRVMPSCVRRIVDCLHDTVYLLGCVQLFFDVSVCALRCPVFLANRKSYTKK